LYILKIESRYTLRMYSRVGKHIPLYCTAIGKILLSYMEEKEQIKIVRETKLVPFTPHTIQKKDALLAELQEIREKGYAQDREEHEEGISCIAAPIYDSTGAVVAAISVSWPVFRFTSSQSETYIHEIKTAADEISRILGFLPT